MKLEDKIYIAGHRGFVGKSLVETLRSQGFKNLILRNRSQLNLLSQQGVSQFFLEERPDYVILAAARVGGIGINQVRKAEFIYENLTIQNNVIHESYRNGVKKLLFLGSSCIYPRDCRQPIREEYLLSGPLEPTNDAYALSKIAGIFMCKSYRSQYGADFISCMPSNLYGPGDNFDLDTSHVLAALIHRFHLAKINRSTSVTLWGTGSPRREMLYVDDLARGCIDLMKHYSSEEPINIGCGVDYTILELADLAREVVGFSGEIQWDSTRADGTPRKLLDCSRINELGWQPEMELRSGIEKTYRWFVDQI
jgi:GDP-L-fucose synthase